MIYEYLKLIRSFNSSITGISPVMGAIVMGESDIFRLLFLFLIGIFGHSFGFIYNDIADYRIDKTEKEISDRPLVSGTISLKKAWILAIISMLFAFFIALYIAVISNNFFPIVILFMSAFFIILYDLVSKKYPFMDILVAIGIFLFVLYGALTVNGFNHFNNLVWIVCFVGSIQSLFLQLVAGGMKDIQNDYNRGAISTAIKMGVRIKDEGYLYTSKSFLFLSNCLILFEITLVFLPFLIIEDFKMFTYDTYIQWIIIIIVASIIFVLTNKFLLMKEFRRYKARRFIGGLYILNFIPVPIMLMTLNPYIGLLAFLPTIGFVLSNIFVHRTLFQPKTM